MPKTGDMNDRSGIYRSMCCHYEAPLKRNEFLPPCTKCGEEAKWAFIVPGHKSYESSKRLAS